MTSFIINSIGIVGMLIILFNLFLLETGREEAKSRQYLFIGLSGSLLLLFYSYSLESFVFFFLHLVFVSVYIFWLVKSLAFPKKNKNRKKR